MELSFPTEKRQELLASRIAAGVSVLLAVFKLMAGTATGSLSLTASAFDSIFDAIASFVGYLLLRMSLEPADKEHPYGHSRIEAVASFGQGGLLFFISAGLVFSASQRFDHLHEPQNLDSTILVPLVCAIVTLVLWTYMGRVVRATGSSVIAADRFHYFSDMAGNFLLVLGFGASRFWHLYNVDAILTLILSLFMFAGGIRIIMDAVKELVDYSDEDAEKAITKIVGASYPEALGIHRIRSRKSGRRSALDIELLSCRQLKFQEVHRISHKVQRQIVEELPHVDVIIHSEPCRAENCPTDRDCILQAQTKKS